MGILLNPTPSCVYLYESQNWGTWAAASVYNVILVLGISPLNIEM